MIERFVETALRQRFLVGVFSLLLVAYGGYVTTRLPVAAFPDVTSIQVQVNTEAPGLSATDVEQLITFPVETSMMGLPSVTQVRSISKFGLSAVTVVFEDGVDTYFARQLVFERLAQARDRIPEGMGSPQMGPITTGLGQIYQYTIEGGGRSAMELRTLNDWVVKYQLRGVPGVADVLSFGGEVRQYQVEVDPDRLLRYQLTIADVADAITANNRNAGGQYLVGASEQLVVRGVGLIRGEREGLADIANIVIRSEDGTPIRVSDVADVEYGAEVRQGAVSKNGRGEVVSGIVLQLQGANTRDVVDRVAARIAAIQGTLPHGVRIVPYYDQGKLTDQAIKTVTDALLASAVLIMITLFLFLGNIRAALVVVASIPLSLMVAFLMMARVKLDANLMSLGGLSIGIGMMVDGSIVMVENIFRVLAEHPHGDRLEAVGRAAREVARPVFFAVLIIVAVFLPLFTLQGVEGKLFGPLAFTTSFAMVGSLITALAIVPALTTVVLRGKLKEEDPAFVRLLKRAYRPILAWALTHRRPTLAGATLLLVGALAMSPFLGTEFVPELEEGTLTIRVTMLPTVSLPQALDIGQRIEKRLLEYPEVTYALSRIGRAELGGDPEPVSNNEIYVGLRSPGEFDWVTAPNRVALGARMTEELTAEFPGVLFNFSQPIATRVDELLSGVKAQIAVKIFGDDLDTLADQGRRVEAVIRGIRGATDVQTEQIEGEAQLVVRANREAMARYAVNVSDVMDVVQNGIGGESATEVLEGNRRFDVYVRVQRSQRSSAEAIGRLLVPGAGSARVPLAQVADIAVEEAPPQVSHEQGQRRVVVQCNVRGRDMGGFVAEAQREVQRQAPMPPGYHTEWGGQFENQQRAERTLMVVVPMSMLLILLLLYLSFNSVRDSLLVICNVPFAVIGGIFALAGSGQYLSVPSAVGFIAVFGVAVLNGVVLVACINTLYRGGMDAREAAAMGALQRLRPVLMTASVAMLGLIPLLLSSEVGSEVQRPLATVVVGGLLTSTPMTLLVLPVLYTIFGRRPEAEVGP
jgi:cobalt-zinc-cadmium resistance protein CzcA